MSELLSIRDVGRRIGVAPHRIAYAHTQERLPEPRYRVGGHRVYTPSDVQAVAAYFAESRKNQWKGAMEHETFTTRRVGTAGHEILGPDGTIIGWTADEYWAAVVVSALNQTEECRRHYAAASPITRNTNDALLDPQLDEDLELVVARRAIAYLARHGITVRWDFLKTDPPSEAVQHLIVRYFADGEIIDVMSEMITAYLLQSLVTDYLRLGSLEDNPPP